MDGFLRLMASVNNNGAASRQQEMCDAQTTMAIAQVETNTYLGVNTQLKKDIDYINQLIWELNNNPDQYGGKDVLQAEIGEAQTQFQADNTQGQSAENTIDAAVQSEQSDTSATATNLQQKAAELGQAVTSVQTTLSQMLGQFPTS